MEENTTPPPERRCAACGSMMPAESRFCGACGTESLPSAADETAVSVAQQTPVMSDAPVAPVAPVAPSAAAAPAAAPTAPASEAPASEPSAARAGGEADGRVCSWCGAVNGREAVTCASCGAVFPTPAGDEALERAARARIQSIESELKQRKSGWWPFRSR
ncbi:MAG TPA: zinc ribbon domain-containing protein [Ktedonobacterales bacterium]|nr:zinc ribbon domain-containing protein [Ktedonobacterales bacterium]